MATRAVGSRAGQRGHAQGVGRDEAQPVGVRPAAASATVSGERAGEPRVDLDGRDVPATGQQREGQRAETGTDLDDDVVGPDAGQPDDLAHRVGVDDEVLAPLLRRPHPEPLGELADLRRPEERGVVDVPAASFLSCAHPRATIEGDAVRSVR